MIYIYCLVTIMCFTEESKVKCEISEQTVISHLVFLICLCVCVCVYIYIYIHTMHLQVNGALSKLVVTPTEYQL